MTNTASLNGTNVAKPFTNRLVNEFIGTLVAVDKEKQTVSIATGRPAKANRDNATVISITQETKIFKDQTPATLADGIVGQEVRYSYRINRENNMRLLTLLRFTTNAPVTLSK